MYKRQHEKIVFIWNRQGWSFSRFNTVFKKVGVMESICIQADASIATSSALRGAARVCYAIDDAGLFPQPKQSEHPTPPIKDGLDVLQTKSGRVIYWNDTTYYRLDGSVMPTGKVDSILTEANNEGAFDKINWDM